MDHSALLTYITPDPCVYSKYAILFYCSIHIKGPVAGIHLYRLHN